MVPSVSGSSSKMRSHFLTLFAALAIVAVEVHGERLIWSDEFDSLDQGKWTHLVTGWDGGNGEFQYFRNNRKNSFVRDGKLFLRATATVEEIGDLEHGRIAEPGCNMQPCVSTGGDGGDIINPYFSARISTKNTFSFTYGRVEIRAKMPSGDWLWPAFWMLPTDEIYGGWPRSGEIDIFEIRGNPDLRSPDGGQHGRSEVGSTLHFGPHWDYKNYINGMKQAAPGRSWSDDFHTYEFIWTPDVMKFLVDGQEIQTINIPPGGFAQLGNLNTDIWKNKGKNAPFDQRFHLICNLAVAGAYFPGDWKSAGQPRPWGGWGSRRQFWNSRGSWQHTWGSPDDQSLQVDYIRVYQN